ncbi:conserved hypothetical protein [Leishmania major strain Friedlin]|uniref:Uncharacterized protein n=1 Tax=Leishmania major TaxID=5664 RepID=Q4QI48_LEIMA|nr:conserved hypothetical protein [Leishmania major strain Friedlin]CAG9569420.1 hypothetical_protein_-_conserved [Leishmania major strain Friedlin]CAJ02311.1 conserved hypothetical protein [Leishmania major strain Friedlin]|eukprot:XP_001681150.1 conserved hypothetical protein [Leishmania major strain Friedlin]
MEPHMTSLVLRRDLSLEVPKLLIGAVQPYQTLAGPALTTSFLHQPDLLPFQRTAFSHAAVAPLYFHTLLHTLAEFAETPRAVQYSAVKLRHAPKADFWDSVGTLNCFYYSAHAPYGAPVEASVLDQHPAMGAVELVRPGHRMESDVKLTLFNDSHQPIASMLMTGPNGAPRETDDDAVESSQGTSSTSPHARTAFPYVAPPTKETTSASDCLSAVMIGGTRVYGGLYGDLMPMESGGGFGQRACYRVEDAAAYSPSLDARSRVSGTEAAAGERTASSSASTVMPPWVLYDCVQRFFLRLHRSGIFGGDAAVAPTEGWRVSAHHVVQTEDAVFGVPVEVVCAVPRVYPSYRLPPWRHRLGLPAIPNGAPPCVCLRCETRQGGRLVSTGVYFFNRW